MKFTIKNIFVIVLASVSLLFAGQAMAKKQTMQIGYSVSEGHPYGTFMFTFADRMEKFSANLESGAI